MSHLDWHANGRCIVCDCSKLCLRPFSKFRLQRDTLVNAPSSVSASLTDDDRGPDNITVCCNTRTGQRDPVDPNILIKMHNERCQYCPAVNVRLYGELPFKACLCVVTETRINILLLLIRFAIAANMEPYHRESFLHCALCFESDLTKLLA